MGDCCLSTISHTPDPPGKGGVAQPGPVGPSPQKAGTMLSSLRPPWFRFCFWVSTVSSAMCWSQTVRGKGDSPPTQPRLQRMPQGATRCQTHASRDGYLCPSLPPSPVSTLSFQMDADSLGLLGLRHRLSQVLTATKRQDQNLNTAVWLQSQP